MARSPLERLWTPAERRELDRLCTPQDVQAFLNQVPYSSDKFSRSPRRVLADRRAHCYDGALLAAAALRRQGLRPLLVDLRAVRDDDHVLAVFQRRGLWGAVAKSNFVGLRYREPIHRSLRELAVSYFNDYFNEHGEKTLRSYSTPVDLSRFDRWEWTVREERLEDIAGYLDRARHTKVLGERQVAELAPVDERTLQAGMLGTDPAGLYRG